MASGSKGHAVRDRTQMISIQIRSKPSSDVLSATDSYNICRRTLKERLQEEEATLALCAETAAEFPVHVGPQVFVSTICALKEKRDVGVLHHLKSISSSFSSADVKSGWFSSQQNSKL